MPQRKLFRRWMRGWLQALAALAAVAGATGAPAQESAPAAKPPVLLPWVDLAGSRPLSLQLHHEILYDPSAKQTVRIERSDWAVERLDLRLFGGEARLVGRGNAAADRPADLSTTVTLERIDIESLMRFLRLPRVGEIQGQASGRIGIDIRRGEWARVDVTVRGEPGTVRISRRLIKDVLIQWLKTGIDPRRIDELFDHYYGTADMLPFEGVVLTGSLGAQQLELKIPLQNQALNSLFEPRIEREALWGIWRMLKSAGLDRVQGASLFAGSER